MVMETLSQKIRAGLRSYKVYHWIGNRYAGYRKARSYMREAARLAKLTANQESIEELVALGADSSIFTSNQKVPEILGLLTLVKRLRPKTILEIGTQRGGTLYLFSQVSDPAARIFSIDLKYPSPEFRRSLPRLANQRKKIYCLQADSHIEDTFQRIQRMIGNAGIDFLFIDGDHEYGGVKRDFDLYSSLVNEGGLIGFHDIVPDNYLRFGIRSNSYVGGVPVFWNELKDRFSSYQEFIQDKNQDGFGIGVVILE